MIRVKSDPANKRAFISIEKAGNNHRRAIRNASFDIGRKNTLDIRKNIKMGRKSGRIYRIGGRVHRASAAGEAPASQSGRLLRSAGYEVRGTRQVSFGYKRSAHYGEYLEDGTRKMKERPNVKRVHDANIQTFINYMVRSFNEDR